MTDVNGTILKLKQHCCEREIFEDVAEWTNQHQTEVLQPWSGLTSLCFVLKMHCTSYIHLQDSDCSGTRSISQLGADQEFWVNAQGLTLNTVETRTSVSQIVNVGTDLEGRT